MYDQIRRDITQIVVPAFSQQYPDFSLVCENEPFNWDNPPQRFVEFEVEFQHGSQVGASANPKTRYAGYVYICVHVREGVGSTGANEVLAWFAQTLGYRRAGLAQLGSPIPDGNSKPSGWYLLDLKVPFYSSPV